MCCKCKAVSNDRRRVGGFHISLETDHHAYIFANLQAVEEQRNPKPSVETPRVVSLVPARHQACRVNNPHLYRFSDDGGRFD